LDVCSSHSRASRSHCALYEYVSVCTFMIMVSKIQIAFHAQCFVSSGKRHERDMAGICLSNSRSCFKHEGMKYCGDADEIVDTLSSMWLPACRFRSQGKVLKVASALQWTEKTSAKECTSSRQVVACYISQTWALFKPSLITRSRHFGRPRVLTADSFNTQNSPVPLLRVLSPRLTIQQMSHLIRPVNNF
jgi:hypothetical protein